MEEVFKILKEKKKELQATREDQQAMREGQRTMQEELEGHKSFQEEMREFRQETKERFTNLEKLVIQNGEKLDNNRQHVSKKIPYFEHKNVELEQRIFELETRYGR